MDNTERFAKGGRAKYAQKFDPSIKGSSAQRSGERPVLPGYKKDGLGKIVPVPGYPKWAKDNTSTKNYDPQNLVHQSEGEPNKPAPNPNPIPNTKSNGNTVEHDGETDVVVSHMNKQLPQIGSRPAPKQRPGGPCLNAKCRSFGILHFGCLCYNSGSDEMWFASGGCIGPHKEKCEHYADGDMVKENEAHLNDPADAIDHVAVNHGLMHLLTKLGKSRSENPHKPVEDYVESARAGHRKIKSHISNIVGKSDITEPDKNSRDLLKSSLSEIESNPQNMASIGGGLGDAMPVHAAMLASRAGNAVNYLNSLKPHRAQTGPLSPVQKPDKQSEAIYNRHLDFANNPSLILQHAKDGTIQPSDLATITTLYPSLMQSIKQKVYAAIVDAKEKGTEIPYKQRMGFSALLGEPLDYTVTPQAMLAIMKANAGAQMPSQNGPAKGAKKASQTELNQINKTNQLSETPNQTRLADKKE